MYYSDGTSWTSTSIRGEQGETGNGIASAVLNDDYTLTLTFTDGTSYTTSSIRGEQGPQGEPGEVTLAQLESVLPTDTASGAIASFPDGSDLFDYLSCVVDIEPIQSGSGTPSPDNVRPITGWTGCNVVVSPTQDAQDGTTYPVSWQTEAGTVYGGTVDVVTGVLTVTMVSVDLSTFSFTYASSYSTSDRAVWYVSCNGKGAYTSVPANCLSEKYEVAGTGAALLRANVVGIASNSTPNRIWCSTTSQSLQPSGQFVYELATPTTYQLTPTQIHALLGQNNVWADCGDVEVQYKADVQRWVDKMLNA